MIIPNLPPSLKTNTELEIMKLLSMTIPEGESVCYSLTEISKILGHTHSLIYDSVKALEERGLIKSEKIGKKRLCILTDKGFKGEAIIIGYGKKVEEYEKLIQN
jgi:DNA-binding MarR family transcriptional regulator